MDLLKSRLTKPDSRSHAHFVADMRVKQAAGGLNRQSIALLDQLARAVV